MILQIWGWLKCKIKTISSKNNNTVKVQIHSWIRQFITFKFTQSWNTYYSSVLTKLNDQLNILSKITFSRILNDALVIGSYYSSKLSGRAQHWGFPISVSIEPTTSCNLRCPECPSGLRDFTRPTGMLESNFYQKIINQIQTKTIERIFFKKMLYSHIWYSSIICIV